MNARSLAYQANPNLVGLAEALAQLLGVPVEPTSIGLGMSRGSVYVRTLANGMQGACERLWRRGEIEYYNVDRARRTVVLQFAPVAGLAYEVSTDDGATWSPLAPCESVEEARDLALMVIGVFGSDRYEGTTYAGGHGRYAANGRRVQFRVRS